MPTTTRNLTAIDADLAEFVAHRDALLDDLPRLLDSLAACEYEIDRLIDERCRAGASRHA